MLKLNNWYLRLLVSYFPILVLTVSMIIFLSFIAVNEISRSETAKADKITTGYVVNSVERAVREVEFNVLKEAESNKSYAAYLNGTSESTTIKYNVVHSLRGMIDNNDLVESIYLYRQSDDTVLTSSGETELSEFGDRDFIKKAIANREYQGWSASREFREYDGLKPVQVISMYKQTPLPFGKDGILVININLYGVEQLIGSMTNHQVSFMRITDSAAQPIYPGDGLVPKGKVLTTLTSGSLAWTFESGIQAGHLLSWVSVVSYVWVIIAVLTFVVAIVYIIWVTRRNYKPIRLMMNRIQALHLRGSDGTAVKLDDMTMIDRALENLIVQSQDHEKEQRESIVLRRRQLFNELISGQRSEQMLERLRSLNLLPSSGRFAAMVVKLNNYEEFQADNTLHEQNVLKFALGNVMQELANNEGLQGWGEWLASDRITFVFASGDTGTQMLDQLRRTAEVAREWVEGHLRFNLSIGIGSIGNEWTGIGRSYRDALTGMEYQFAIGRNAVTFSGDIPQIQPNGMFNYTQQCTNCVQEFRLTNESWRDTFEQLFKHFETDAMKDEDILSLIQLFLQMLSRELKELSDTLNECLDGAKISELLISLRGASTLPEMKELLSDYLIQVYETYVAMSQTKGYKTMITEIRAYIQENFADPDLSLKHLSDRFEISGKYASHLFKLEYDMKFVDFLVQLRMQQAERLLAETEDTVQNIALQVGYANSITFGRVFKRLTGVTPGEFRKLKMRPSNLILGMQGNREAATTES
ncbi:helix-turn-helix domain-containing protein [Paenibacillus glycanilyticus]|uniref:helix-turn-helix domain-containing protein n=1 Tax=Paenibacillus glycanilyticus TaxID=126569 RepID=UPI00203FC5E7|nr:helix-turn-helix domain-containing protein [Paenibacillus glycanilyticus]MCM3626834.1 helix-turn-helix domain-containing protein [Paenibacillus glycanilyticus]